MQTAMIRPTRLVPGSGHPQTGRDAYGAEKNLRETPSPHRGAGSVRMKPLSAPYCAFSNSAEYELELYHG